MTIDPNFSSIWFALLVLAVGLGMLVAGGDLLISGATRLASRLGMSPLLIGLTVVAFGTSMPEMFVSITATLGGHQDIMFGNIVGSNIANVGLVLALSAIFYPLSIVYKDLSTEFILISGASFICIAAAYFGVFPRILGFAFSLGLIAYTVYSYRAEHKSNKSSTVEITPATSAIVFYSYYAIMSFCFAGLTLMWFGSDYFIKGAVDLARYFGLSELVIGLTLAAVGTSLPELASSISAIKKKQGDMLVGNILGSNLFNLLLVLGSTAAIKSVLLPEIALTRDLPIMTFFTVILIPLAIFSKKISRVSGFVLLSCYCGYIYILA